MPISKCGFGFSCASMLLQPGLEPVDCPNYRTCGGSTQLTPDEQVELIRVRAIEWQVREVERQAHRQEWEIAQQAHRQEWERTRETIRVSRRSAAAAMLMQRGRPQTLENFGINDTFASIEQQIQTLRTRASEFTTNRYIAPDNCEAHRYNVKRSSGTYIYNKLTSKEAIFAPSTEANPVKVIHLSHDDDPRNLEGRLGIERRNRLHQAETQLKIAAAAIEEAIALLTEQRG